MTVLSSCAIDYMTRETHSLPRVEDILSRANQFSSGERAGLQFLPLS